MSETSTSAPKMHIAAAPASRKEPGSSSHAEYQGGCTASPRLMIRAAANTSVAVIKAGPVKANAQLNLTDPAAAAMTGCTPAIARPAATANPTRRRMMLGRGTSVCNGDEHVVPAGGLKWPRVVSTKRGECVVDEAIASLGVDCVESGGAVPPAAA